MTRWNEYTSEELLEIYYFWKKYSEFILISEMSFEISNRINEHKEHPFCWQPLLPLRGKNCSLTWGEICRTLESTNWRSVNRRLSKLYHILIIQDIGSVSLIYDDNLLEIASRMGLENYRLILQKLEILLNGTVG